MSRLNRSHPDKKDTFILDFVNEPGVIKEAFDRYYKTTILSGETDVNKLNDLIDTMESIQVYSDADVDTFAKRSTAALTIFWNLYPIKKKYKAKDKKWR